MSSPRKYYVLYEMNELFPDDPYKGRVIGESYDLDEMISWRIQMFEEEFHRILRIYSWDAYDEWYTDGERSFNESYLDNPELVK